ncbi:MAG: 3'-5' exonuclease [Rickettsiales bacterium]|nr:3'-5' exonuclease [Rickettsiales bacterium]
MLKENIFIFDIETIPDIESARRLLKMDRENDLEVHEKIAAYHDSEKKAEEVFLKPIFHKIVAISFVEVAINRDYGFEEYQLLDVRSGGKVDSTEEDLVKGFFKYLENKTPRLVSFNGRAFDLPVLKFRAMKYGINSSIYKLGDKWNNYMQRYSSDWHNDLHETLTDYFACGRLKLDEACKVFGYPGKIDVDGSTVFDLYNNGKIQEIRDYCETDVLNTYLVYLSYSLHFSLINKEGYEAALNQVKNFLEINKEKEHINLFLEKLNLYV